MSGEERKSIKIDKSQWERAKKLKEKKGKDFKRIFEQGLIFYEKKRKL